MKTILILILFPIAYAAEESRTWTDTAGRTLQGRLVAKTTESAEVALANGKRVKLSLEKLSPDDKSYVEKANVNPDPSMLVKTAAVKSNAAGTKKDERKIIVTITGADERALTIRVVWLGDNGDKGKYGVFFEDKREVSGNDNYEFSALYSPAGGSKNDRNYKGYAVQLLDGEKVIATQASQKPFERFLTYNPKP
jgi:hypothetical protein